MACNTDPMKSTVGCGCDPGADHVCQRHNSVNAAEGQTMGRAWSSRDAADKAPYNPAGRMASSAGVFDVPEPQPSEYAPNQQICGASEVRVTDPTTGGEKGSKLARFDLIPSQALWGLAEVYGRGAKKYADRNWERGYAWGLSMAALERHYNQWKQGESIDGETGAHHLLQVAWHAFTLYMFQMFGRGTDDRSTFREKLADTVTRYRETTTAAAAPQPPHRYTCPRDGQLLCCEEGGYRECCVLTARAAQEKY